MIFIAKLTPSIWIFVKIPDHPNDSFCRGKMFLSVKDSVFEPSTALRYTTEQYKIATSEYKHTSPVQLILADGGSEHRNRNGSVKIALICYFLECDCDFLASLNTCPYNSWVNPAERGMPILKIGWGNESLCRSSLEDPADEAFISWCGSMKALRSKLKNQVDRFCTTL